MKSKLPVPTAKDINEAHRLARSAAETAVEHAIRCGQMLIQVGADQAWVERHTEIAWSTAKRYVTAAKQNAQGIAFESLRHCFPSGQKTRAAAEKRGESATAVAKKGALAAEIDTFSGPDTTARSVKGGVMNPPESAAQGSEAGNRNTPSGEESGAREAARSPVRDEPTKPIEVAPEPAHDFSGYEPEDDDAFKANIENVLMADDKLAAMREELKQCHREMQGLKASRDHYQSEAGAAVRLVKARDREIEKLKKDLAKARGENESLRERISIMEAA